MITVFKFIGIRGIYVAKLLNIESDLYANNLHKLRNFDFLFYPNRLKKNKTKNKIYAKLNIFTKTNTKYNHMLHYNSQLNIPHCRLF